MPAHRRPEPGRKGPSVTICSIWPLFVAPLYKPFQPIPSDFAGFINQKNRSGQTVRVAREIDFVAAKGGKKTYIQSAYALETDDKAAAENRPLALTGDSFPKIIVRHDIRKRWYDENGVLNIGVTDFLLDETLI